MDREKKIAKNIKKEFIYESETRDYIAILFLSILIRLLRTRNILSLRRFIVKSHKHVNHDLRLI